MTQRQKPRPRCVFWDNVAEACKHKKISFGRMLIEAELPHSMYGKRDKQQLPSDEAQQRMAAFLEVSCGELRQGLRKHYNHPETASASVDSEKTKTQAVYPVKEEALSKPILEGEESMEEKCESGESCQNYPKFIACIDSDKDICAMFKPKSNAETATAVSDDEKEEPQAVYPVKQETLSKPIIDGKKTLADWAWSSQMATDIFITLEDVAAAQKRVKLLIDVLNGYLAR